MTAVKKIKKKIADKRGEFPPEYVPCFQRYLVGM